MRHVFPNVWVDDQISYSHVRSQSFKTVFETIPKFVDHWWVGQTLCRETIFATGGVKCNSKWTTYLQRNFGNVARYIFHTRWPGSITRLELSQNKRRRISVPESVVHTQGPHWFDRQDRKLSYLLYIVSQWPITTMWRCAWLKDHVIQTHLV